MKWVVGILLFVLILLCGCSSNQPEVVEMETTSTTIIPTPVAVTTATWIQTVGPTPTPTNDVRECYNHSVTEYPDYCYDYFYWVKPTPTPPVGTGYTARVWRNSGCVNLNKTSGICEEWGDDLYTVLFLRNLTIVKNITSINNTELVASVVYYNKTHDLNTVNDDLTFSDFINMYWDGTYPGEKYNTSEFKPNVNVTIVPVDTFNPDGF